MMRDPIYFVGAPPPTPNGDLHVGHLSGPYLAADVFARYRRLRGSKVLYAFGTDRHQSYVVTTAERTGRDPHELARDNLQRIRATLRAADINVGTVGEPDSQYEKFVCDFFRKLHQAEAFATREQVILRDPVTGRYLVESYIQGACPTCLNPTKGNICEVCGHPNDPATLLHPSVTGAKGAATLERHNVRCLFLHLDRYRSRMEEYYRERESSLRPAIRRLLHELLSGDLPELPITQPANWGIPAPFPGFESSVINVWAEAYPGHLYWFDVERRRQDVRVDSSQAKYVQFFGFDNSFCYAVLHVGLAFAAEMAGYPVLIPDQFITNEFYLLQHQKFSTSLSHLIWGRDLLATFSADAVRFYLALTNPELQQTNFAVDEISQRVTAELISPFERVVMQYNTLTNQGESLAGDVSAWEGVFSVFRDRMESAFERMSLRIAAQTIAAYLQLVVQLAADRPAHGSPQRRRTELHAALAHLAVFSSPIMPSFASRLARALGLADPVTWSREATFPAGRVSPAPPNLLTLAALTNDSPVASPLDDHLERDFA
jgi:methionyl-tRNA synthetase